MRVFGFDLGIASIGWAVVDINKENDNPETGPGVTDGQIIKSGVRIFSIAENPKNGKSLATPRRDARLARRSLRRKALRMKEIRTILINNGLPVPSLLPLKGELDGAVSVWQLRGEDVFNRKLEPAELARLLLYIGKHRGFKSIRKSQEEADIGDTGKVLAAIHNNKELMVDFKTMAQMIFKTKPKMRNRGTHYVQRINKKSGEPEIVKEAYYGSSIPRNEIEIELGIIFNAQKQYEIFTENLLKEYKEIIFRQREIKSVGSMVGKCTLEPDFLRAPKESPTGELFVALTKINNMKITINGITRNIEPQERTDILELLKKTETIKYSNLRTKIWKNQDMRFWDVDYKEKKNKDGEVLDKNPEDKKFYSMPGWHKLKKIIDIDDLSDIKMLDRIIKVIAMEKNDDEIDKKLKHKKIPEKYIPKLQALSSAGFLNLSLRALYKIIPEMEKGATYDKACEAVGYDLKKTGAVTAVADGDLIGEIKEQTRVPVVNRTMSQFRKVYNAMVREYGRPPDKVNLEVGRELKKTFDERKKDKANQEKNRDDRAEVMENLGQNARGRDVAKYRLYKLQDCKCPYSGEPIDINNLDNYEVDHILPYSRSLDNSFNNKVLVKYEENQAKGNKTPFEYLNSQGRWEEFAGRINATKSLGLQRMHNLLNKEFDEKESKFRERNANDNAYISIHIKRILNDAFPNLPVNVRTGYLTSYLRGQWGLEKNRTESDKHHAQDAIVIACATQGAVQYLSTISGLFENKRNSKGKPWWNNLKSHIREPWVGFRGQVLDSVGEIFVSRPPRCKATGQLHEDTINGMPNSINTKNNRNKKKNVGKGSLPIRNGMAVEGEMFRFDVFKKDKKFSVVPVYISDITNKDRKDIFYPSKFDSDKNPLAIDDTYEFMMTLHKDDYIKIKTTDDREYEGYIVQCKIQSKQFVIRNSDNSAVFSIDTRTFEKGEIIIIEIDDKKEICKVIGFDASTKKLQAQGRGGIIHEIPAILKTSKDGTEKKQIQLEKTYEKLDSEKSLSIGTFANLEKYHIGILGDKSQIKLEKREKVANIKIKKRRKQPKRKNNGMADSSGDKTV